MTHEEFDRKIAKIVDEWPEAMVNIGELWYQVIDALDDMVNMSEIDEDEAQAHARRCEEAIKEMVLLGAVSPSKVYH
jgi:hypothetical protein